MSSRSRCSSSPREDFEPSGLAHLVLVQLLLPDVELAPALLQERLRLGEGAVALGDPLGVEGIRVEQVSLELGELAFPVGEPTLLHAQPVALLGEALLPRGQLGF